MAETAKNRPMSSNKIPSLLQNIANEKPTSESKPKRSAQVSQISLGHSPQQQRNVVTSFAEHMRRKSKESSKDLFANSAKHTSAVHPNTISNRHLLNDPINSTMACTDLNTDKSNASDTTKKESLPALEAPVKTNRNIRPASAAATFSKTAEPIIHREYSNQSQKPRSASVNRRASVTENGILVKRRLSLFEPTANDISASEAQLLGRKSSLAQSTSEFYSSQKSASLVSESNPFSPNHPSNSYQRGTSATSKNGSIASSIDSDNIQEEKSDRVQSLIAGSISASPMSSKSNVFQATNLQQQRHLAGDSLMAINSDSQSNSASPRSRRQSVVKNSAYNPFALHSSSNLLNQRSHTEDYSLSHSNSASPRSRRQSIVKNSAYNPFAPSSQSNIANSDDHSDPNTLSHTLRRPSLSSDQNPMSMQRRASRRDTIIGLFQQKMNAAKNSIIAETSYIRRPISDNSITFWTRVYRVLKLGFLGAKIGRQLITEKMKGIAEPSLQKQQTLTQTLKVNPTVLDPEYLKRIEKLLSQPAGKRPALAMEEIEKLFLLRVKDYEKFNEAERAKICQIVRFDAYPKDTVILWEEHIVTCFYFILSGQLEIFKLNKGSKLPLVLWNQGMALGHARIKVENATRSACASTTVDTVLLTVDRVDYMRIVQEVEQDLHPKLLLLGELSIFVKEKELFSKVSPLMKVQYIQRGETIVSEGDQAERMFWIISGECTVSKIVPFVSIAIHGFNSVKTGKYTLEAYTGQTIGPDDKKVDHQLEIQDLGPGDWFPALEQLGSNKEILRYDGAEKLQKDAYLNYYGKTIIRNDSTIKANSKMILVSIPFFDFINHCSKEVLFQMITDPVKHTFTIPILQEQYLAQKSWGTHRKHVVEELNISL